MIAKFTPHATYSETADAVYVYLSEGTAVRTVALDDARNVDYGADGRVVGIEFLEASDGIDLRGVPDAERVRELLPPRVSGGVVLS